jgi:hypothetical protein
VSALEVEALAIGGPGHGTVHAMLRTHSMVRTPETTYHRRQVAIVVPAKALGQRVGNTEALVSVRWWVLMPEGDDQVLADYVAVVEFGLAMTGVLEPGLRQVTVTENDEPWAWPRVPLTVAER